MISRATGWFVFASLALACGGATETTSVGGDAGWGGSGGATSGGAAGVPGTTTGAGGPVSGTGGGGAANDAGGGPTVESIAMLVSQVPPEQLEKDPSVGFWLDTGEKLDPTTLVIGISDQGSSCATPQLRPGLGPPSHTFLLVGLPQAMQKTGKYDFASTDVIAWENIWVGDSTGGRRRAAAPDGNDRSARDRNELGSVHALRSAVRRRLLPRRAHCRALPVVSKTGARTVASTAKESDRRGAA